MLIIRSRCLIILYIFFYFPIPRRYLNKSGSRAKTTKTCFSSLCYGKNLAFAGNIRRLQRARYTHRPITINQIFQAVTRFPRQVNFPARDKDRLANFFSMHIHNSAIFLQRSSFILPLYDLNICGKNILITSEVNFFFLIWMNYRIIKFGIV